MGNSDPECHRDPRHGAERSGSEPATAPQGVGRASENGTGVPGDQAADGELLGALAASLLQAAHVDHALDALTTSVDLFDIPAWDSDVSG